MLLPTSVSKNPCLLSGMTLTLITVSQAWMLLVRCRGDGDTHTGAGGRQAELTTVSTDKEALPACRLKLCSLPQSCTAQAGKQSKQMKVTRSLSVLQRGL